MAGKQQKTAGNRKKSNSGRKTTTRKKTSEKNNKQSIELTPEEREQQQGIHDEIVVIAILALSILLILSNFNLCGRLGVLISNITFGFFGYMAYILPFAFFFGISFFIANRGNRLAKIKLTAAIFCYLFFTIFVHMVTEPYDAGASWFGAFKESAAGHNGGGLIGGIAVKILHPLLGTVGCYVLVAFFILISIVLMTQRSFVIPLGKKGKNAYTKASMQHREQRKLRREQRESERAMDRPTASVEEVREKFEKKSLNFDFGLIANTKNKDKNKDKDIEKDIVEEIILPSGNDDLFSERSEDETDKGISEVYMEPAEEEVVFDFPSDIQVIQDISEPKREGRIGTADGDMRPIVIREDAPEPSATAVAKASAKADAMKADAPTEEEKQKTAEHIEAALEKMPEYKFPPVSLLVRGEQKKKAESDANIRQTALKLKSTLESFGVKVQITNYSRGSSVTRYEIQPEQGVKVSKIVNLSDDIRLNLAVADIRIEAPIPGKAAIGIEVPNKEKTPVLFRDLIESQEFKTSKSDIAFAVGTDIGGKVIMADISKMPHLLIAGATGSGKSVCINTLIMSIIYKAKPEDVRLIMVDPKVVELSVYNGIPHLLIPVVTDPKKAAGALNWAVMEMTDRYKKFAELNVRDLKGYNEKILNAQYQSPDYPKLPQIVIIVDELADLMMVAPGEVEDAICRLAQLARACGIHLVIATQRPSVNVITGLIKANIPSRIAFSVSSNVDSRTIIDMGGAEKLLGKGDMLFYPSGYQKPLRVQGAFISDKEVNDVVAYLRESQNNQVNYNDDITSKITTTASAEITSGNDRDVYFVEAGKFIIEKDKASIGMLQRVFKIGFNRAARIMDQLCDAGVVGPEEGTKPRKVLMSEEEFATYVEETL